MIDYAATLGKVTVPVLVADRAHRVVFANPAAQRRLGTARSGGDVRDTARKGEQIERLLREAWQNGEARPVKLFAAGTTLREYRVSAVLLDPVADDLAVLTFEDQTPLRIAKSMRSDFVANVSHEIRSPLTAIAGFVESLRDDTDMDDATRALFLELTGKEVERMTNLVADLLSLSKVEAKERRTLRKQVDISGILGQAVETVTRLADRRGKRIAAHVPATLPAITGKHDDLLRVFVNLLENAVNYSRDGAEIGLRAEICADDNPLEREALCISVTDQGEGIPAGEIPRLTERFYRVDKSRSRNVGGTGLGLAIVKHILVRHRGRLVIESEQGVGSVFRVYLPLGGSARA